jgi:hypothetical protein
VSGGGAADSEALLLLPPGPAGLLEGLVSQQFVRYLRLQQQRAVQLSTQFAFFQQQQTQMQMQQMQWHMQQQAQQQHAMSFVGGTSMLSGRAPGMSFLAPSGQRFLSFAQPSQQQQQLATTGYAPGPGIGSRRLSLPVPAPNTGAGASAGSSSGPLGPAGMLPPGGAPASASVSRSLSFGARSPNSSPRKAHHPLQQQQQQRQGPVAYSLSEFMSGAALPSQPEDDVATAFAAVGRGSADSWEIVDGPSADVRTADVGEEYALPPLQMSVEMFLAGGVGAASPDTPARPRSHRPPEYGTASPNAGSGGRLGTGNRRPSVTSLTDSVAARSVGGHSQTSNSQGNNMSLGSSSRIAAPQADAAYARSIRYGRRSFAASGGSGVVSAPSSSSAMDRGLSSLLTRPVSNADISFSPDAISE